MGESLRKAISRETHTYQGVVYDLEFSDYSHRTKVREVLCAGSNRLLALPMAPQPRPMAGCHGTRPFQRLPWKTAYGV